MGSAAMAMSQVAAGRADCYTEYGVHVWDIAAGYLLVKEAGGVVIDTKGRCDIAAGYLLVKEAGGVVIDIKGRCACNTWIFNNKHPILSVICSS